MNSWRDHVRRVVPYTPGEQPDKTDMIKLNTNENPYPPSPRVFEAIEKLGVEKLRLYPDPKASELVNAIAARYGVSEDMVFPGVGSDDVLAMAFMTFFNSEKPVLFPDITYSFYPVWADLYGIPYERPALDKDLHIVKEDYYRENGGIVIANPNAPTSYYEQEDTIRDIIEHNRGSLVIIDEAYVDFGNETMVPLVNEYDNILVVQTFSKSRSGAGLRIGFAIGNSELIKALNDVKYSFNSYTMSRQTIAAGKAAMEDEEYFKETVKKVIETREKAKVRFKELGFSFPEPAGNFIFVTHKKKSAKELFAALRAQDIYVRYFDLPRIDNYLRITVGTNEQMERLFEALTVLVSEE